jgi:ABC-2 type transport system permease protein
VTSSASTKMKSAPISAGYGILSLEFRKLLGFRSVRLGLIVAFVLPSVLTLATLDPGNEENIKQIIGADLYLAASWQVPAMILYLMMPFLLPLLTAVTCAEILGGEKDWGTLAPLLLRPVSRSKIILAKLFVALLYPFLLLLSTLIGSLIVGGLRFGFAGFTGGTGLGDGGFVGVGELTPLAAMLELVRGYTIAGAVLAPVAALAILFGAIYLNTAAAALTTIGCILLMGIVKIFGFIRPLLLTEHLDAYSPLRQSVYTVQNSLILLGMYTLVCTISALLVFDRKDI